jgi:hypothetical protein
MCESIATFAQSKLLMSLFTFIRVSHVQELQKRTQLQTKRVQTPVPTN